MASINYAQMSKDNGMPCAWVKLEMNNMNFRNIIASRNRNYAKMSHIVFSLEKHGEEIQGFAHYTMPYCKFLCFESAALAKYMTEGNKYYAYMSDFDFEDPEEDGYIAVKITFTSPEDPSYLRDKESFEKNEAIVSTLGRQNLFETPTATWICYEYENEKGYMDLRDCSIYRGNIQCNVVGTKMIPGYKNLLSQIQERDTVVLKNEPNNEFDNHAIAVYWNNQFVGHISRRDIPIVALCMENGGIEGGVSFVNDEYINVVIAPTLQHLGDDSYNEEYGPFSAMVKILLPGVSGEVPCTIKKFKELFYYDGPTGNILKN